MVLSALVVHAREPVSTEALADALWGRPRRPRGPRSCTAASGGCGRCWATPAIDRVPSGYRLSLGDDELDHRLFERLLERGREALAEDDPARALVPGGRGPGPVAGAGRWPTSRSGSRGGWRPRASRVCGWTPRSCASRRRCGTGQAAAVLEQARALVAQAPFRERRWALLATALYQSGRQGEALGAVQRARAMLVDELGLDPGARAGRARAAAAAAGPVAVRRRRGRVSAVCPYRGLLPYDAEDAESFFGREDDVAACLRRLRDAGVLVVVGPSGVGKSSLGLRRRGRVPGAGRHAGAGGAPGGASAGLAGRAEAARPPDPGRRPGRGSGHAVRRPGRAGALLHVAGHPRGRRGRARADAPCRPPRRPGAVPRDRAHPRGRPLPARTRCASRTCGAPSRRPAHGAGLRLEPGLVDLMVRDVEGEPAGLPMLSHVLRETWERREGSTLTVDGYKATGGIQHAVSQSAEPLYDAMDEAQRARLRSLLLRLVMPTEDGDPVRARVPRDKVAVDEDHARLVEQLVDARLVSIDGDAVQIAHEALVRVWPRLRGWLDDDVEGQRLFRHLADAGRRVGRAWAARTASSTGGRGSPARWTGGSGPGPTSATPSPPSSRPRRTCPRRSSAPPSSGSGASAGSTAGCGVPWPVSPCSRCCALVAGVLAVRSADRAEGDRDRARAAADLAYARQAGAVALEHDDLSLSLLLALSALAGRRLGAREGHAGRRPPEVAVAAVRAWRRRCDRRPDGQSRRLAARCQQAGRGRGSAPDGCRHPRTAAVRRRHPRQRDRLLPGQQPARDGGEPVDRERSAPRRGSTRSRSGSTTCPTAPWPTGSSADSPTGASVEYDLDFSADGRRLVAAVDRFDAAGLEVLDTTATVWDLADPAEPVLRVDGLGEYPVLKLSPDGTRLYAAVTGADVDRPVRVYDVDSGRLIDSLDLASPGAITSRSGALSPDGGNPRLRHRERGRARGHFDVAARGRGHARRFRRLHQPPGVLPRRRPARRSHRQRQLTWSGTSRRASSCTLAAGPCVRAARLLGRRPDPPPRPGRLGDVLGPDRRT